MNRNKEYIHKWLVEYNYKGDKIFVTYFLLLFYNDGKNKFVQADISYIEYPVHCRKK